MDDLVSAVILLAAAVVTVPLLRRLGFGAVLGFLTAGVIIGPQGLGLIADVAKIYHFAELGVVLLLFVLGLELQPSRLWTMRKPILSYGCLQMFITGGAFAVIGRLLGLDVGVAMVVGLAMALSSTAFALQSLAERQELTTRHGRAAFAILLLQDLVAIPLLAIIPALALGGDGLWDGESVASAATALAVLVAVSVIGRFLLRYGLRVVAWTRVREVFTAAALLTVIGAAALMQQLGLSAALGAFIAGVLLADSEFRHELEADLEPFKGLLLGLFFMAVGMSFKASLILAEPLTLGLMVVGLLVVKLAVLYAVARANGLADAPARALAAATAQGGEFAFVILGAAVTHGLLGQGFADRLIAIVTLSMAATPLLLTLNDRLTSLLRRRQAQQPFDSLPGDQHPVIIAGFGRFGQMVGRILRAKGIGFTALEASPEQVDFVRQYGAKVYYGDAARLDLLQAARAQDAEIFVLAIDDVEASVRTAATVRRHFPHLAIYARARNRQHAYRLMELGITPVWRETFLSATDMAEAVLKGLGLPDYAAERAVATFRAHDEQRLYSHFGAHNDEKRMQALAKQAAQELRELFQADAARDEPRS